MYVTKTVTWKWLYVFCSVFSFFVWELVSSSIMHVYLMNLFCLHFEIKTQRRKICRVFIQVSKYVFHLSAITSLLNTLSITLFSFVLAKLEQKKVSEDFKPDSTWRLPLCLCDAIFSKTDLDNFHNIQLSSFSSRNVNFKGFFWC